MSSFPPPNVQQGAEQAGQQPGQQAPPMAQAPGASPSMGNVPGLPPTALSMQLQSLNDQYQQAQQGGAMGAQMAPGGTGGPLMLDQRGGGYGDGQFGRTSLQDMAERLARGYGLNFGRGTLVDPEGNFLQTPDQMAAAGGELDTTAASMNRVAQALNDRQIEMQQNKATAALQAGMGQIQERGRGSLAALQSNFYQAIAANYTDPNLLPEQADFSFWIQKAGFEEAAQNRAKEDAETGGGGGGAGAAAGAGGAQTKTQRSLGNTNPYSPYPNPAESVDSGPQGKGDVVTSGPNAGKRPVYTYDPIAKTTTVSWEQA